MTLAKRQGLMFLGRQCGCAQKNPASGKGSLIKPVIDQFSYAKTEEMCLKSQSSQTSSIRFAAIWPVGSSSDMIRMGYIRMFGKMFFVALFLSDRAKNDLFCVIFA